MIRLFSIIFYIGIYNKMASYIVNETVDGKWVDFGSGSGKTVEIEFCPTEKGPSLAIDVRVSWNSGQDAYVFRYMRFSDKAYQPEKQMFELPERSEVKLSYMKNYCSEIKNLEIKYTVA
jgi:hypothetical protein